MNYTAGDFILKKLNLILRSNERIDISRLFVDIQLNEDIFSNTIRGVLTINDHTDLLSSAPLLGEETIELECYTPGIEDAKHYINHKFQIYKISDRVRVSADSQLYNIHFASTEYLINELNKISTYLSGNPADSILKIFVGEQYLNSKSLLHIPELPENNLTIATPFWTPFKIINWLAARSIRADSKTADYLFFETLTRGYQYIPITKLIESGENVIKYGDSGVGVNSNGYDIDRDYSTIRSLYVDEVFDFIKKAQTGYYSSRLMTANVLTKSLASSNLKQFEYFDKYPHLNEKNPVRGDTTTSKNSAMYSFINQEYTFDNQRDLNFNSWFLQRINYFSGLTNTYRINIVVPGRFDVGIGRMVEIDKELVRQHNENENYHNQIIDNSSGRFLISAVNHILTAGGRHSMTLECITDSLK
jgi:hypothetical protein